MPVRSVLAFRVGVLFCLAGAWGRAATLSAPAQTASPGQSLVVPLTFSASGDAISGIQFDISWSLPLHVSVSVGDQLRASTKLLYTNQPGVGSLRCLIVGLNRDQIPDGEVLRLLVGLDGTAAAGTATIGISNVFATDPDGENAAITYRSVGIQIQGVISTTLAAGSIVNAASLESGPISPGEIVSIFAPFGSSSSPAVLFDKLPAPILYAGGNQVNAVVPFGLDVSQSASVELRSGAATVGTVVLPTAATSPGLFTVSGTGLGSGAILNQDFTMNSAANPAPRGSVVMLFGAGFGTLSSPVSDGSIENTTTFSLQVTASIAGSPAEVTYSGAAPGLVAGVAQINVRIPATISSSSNAPVLVTIGGATSPQGVTIAIQ